MSLTKVEYAKVMGLLHFEFQLLDVFRIFCRSFAVLNGRSGMAPNQNTLLTDALKPGPNPEQFPALPSHVTLGLCFINGGQFFCSERPKLFHTPWTETRDQFSFTLL